MMSVSTSRNDSIDVQDASEIKIIEIGMPNADIDQKRRRRRRRRRNRSKIVSSPSSDGENNCGACDDSTCATVSLSSDDSSTGTPQKQTQHKQRRKHNKKKNNKLLHQKHNKKNDEQDLPIEEQSRYLALDCEMVGVGHSGKKSSVARVTLVDWNGRIICDEFVRQEQKVTDYRTFVSGITHLDVEDATFGLEDCRQHVQTMIKDKILVGHALKNDLRALGLTHPWMATRDTAKYEPFMQKRFDDNILWPRKLKDLASEKLGRKIQREGEPHSAYEDAAAAMDLYQTVRRKWEKVMDYKIRKTHEIESTKI